nr:Sip1-related alpha-galactosidase [uncultured Vibrio sp.]
MLQLKPELRLTNNIAIELAEQDGQYRYNSKTDQVNALLSLSKRDYEGVELYHFSSELSVDPIWNRNPVFTAQRTVQFKLQEFKAQQFIANYQYDNNRLAQYFCKPFFGHSLNDVPKQTISMLCFDGEEYHYFLPLLSDSNSWLEGDEIGLSINISPQVSHLTSLEGDFLLYQKGSNPYELVEQVCLAACKRLSLLPRDEREYPSALNYLGWCSWDAFYEEVTHAGMLDKAREMKEKAVPFKWFMLDDGWFRLNEKKQLLGFEAHQEGFPHGLKGLTKALKEDFGLDYVGIWHAFYCYWYGLDKNSEENQALAHTLKATRNGYHVPAATERESAEFWDGFHSFIKESGFDFIKVDGQAAIYSYFREEGMIGQSARVLHKGMDDSAREKFSNGLINCMGMAQENILARTTSAVNRNSRDYFPEEEDGFVSHALQNVFNSLFHSEFHYTDFDMFHSYRKDAESHAVLRAVSSGPVYVSDDVGKTDSTYLRPLCHADGKIIRCEGKAKPGIECLLDDPSTTATPLVVENTLNGQKVKAIFNIYSSEEVVNCEIAVNRGSIMFDSLTGKLYKEGSHHLESQWLKPSLLTEYELESGVAVIGFSNKYLPSGTVTKQSATEYQAKGSGEFVVYSDKPVSLEQSGETHQATKVDGELYYFTINAEYDAVTLSVQ